MNHPKQSLSTRCVKTLAHLNNWSRASFAKRAKSSVLQAPRPTWSYRIKRDSRQEGTSRNQEKKGSTRCYWSDRKSGKIRNGWTFWTKTRLRRHRVIRTKECAGTAWQTWANVIDSWGALGFRPTGGEGGITAFYCTVRGSPRPTVEWLFSDGKLVSGGKHLIEEGKLTIKYLNYCGALKYKTVATNILGSLSGSATWTVRGKLYAVINLS